MNTKTKQFIDLLDELGESYNMDYSGRGMYGKTCVSLEYDSEQEVYGLFATMGAMNEQAAIAAARGAKVDSMGLGIVIYWPRFETTEE